MLLSLRRCFASRCRSLPALECVIHPQVFWAGSFAHVCALIGCLPCVASTVCPTTATVRDGYTATVRDRYTIGGVEQHKRRGVHALTLRSSVSVCWCLRFLAVCASAMAAATYQLTRIVFFCERKVQRKPANQELVIVVCDTFLRALSLVAFRLGLSLV